MAFPGQLGGILCPVGRASPEEWQASTGMTEEELVAFYRGLYAERSAPAGTVCDREKGCLPTGCDLFPGSHEYCFGLCDGMALYGYDGELLYDDAATGYRVSLADAV